MPQKRWPHICHKQHAAATTATAATSVATATAAGCCLAACSQRCRSFWLYLLPSAMLQNCRKFNACRHRLPTQSQRLPSQHLLSLIQLPSYPHNSFISSAKPAGMSGVRAGIGEMNDGTEYRAYRHHCHCVSVTSSHPRHVSERCPTGFPDTLNSEILHIRRV